MLRFKGFTLGELGSNAKGFFLGLEISRIEDVVVIIVLSGSSLSSGRVGTRFEYLLGTHQPLAAAGIRAGLGNLLGAHELAVAGFQVATPERTDANAHQFLDAEAEAGEHLAYLALQPLLQHYACAAGRKAGYILGLGLAFRYTYAFKQLNQHTAVKSLIQGYPVLFFYTTTGVGQVLAHAAVVGEDEQTFTVGVQTPHVVCVAVLGRQ